MKKKSIFIIIVAIIIAVTIAGGLIMRALCIKQNLKGAGVIQKNLSDGWVYSNSNNTSTTESKYSRIDASSIIGSIQSSTNDGVSTSSTSSYNSGNGTTSTKTYSNSENYVGYTVGGANNAKNFRENIKNGYLPLSTDITYNGVYSEYYFDTGIVNRKSDELFSQSYSMAISTNPITGEQEYYMSVGLNSNIKESDFNRKKINLVIVLDISGSMSSSFNSYYYDKKINETSEYKSKMKIAEECVNSLIDQLNPDDRIGIVLFDDSSYLGCKIAEIGDTDTESLKNHILEVEPRGGTNFSSGYDKGTELFDDVTTDKDGYQNRIIVITDAMPNLGELSSDGLTRKIKQNANNKIYTSFIGVGVDFNTTFTEAISDVRGFNYYSVHSSEEFKKILADDFDYMITPLVYDLDLSFKSNYYKIANVYGSDSVDKATGNIMHVNTLFPSSSNSDGDVKGGIVVLKLEKLREAEKAEIELNVSYKDTDERSHKNSENVTFKNSGRDYYDNMGIRKAIALARYVGTIKNWTLYEKSKLEEFEANDENNITDFVYDDTYVKTTLGVYERSSVKLTVSQEYKDIFKKLKSYMEEEKDILKDNDLKNEIEILDKLI